MKAFSRRSLIKGFGAAGVLAYPLLRQRRAEAAPIKRRCPWLRAAWAGGPALLATDSRRQPTIAG